MRRLRLPRARSSRRRIARLADVRPRSLRAWDRRLRVRRGSLALRLLFAGGGAPSHTHFMRQLQPFYVEVHRSFEGCAPLGATTVGKDAWLFADCPKGRRAERVGAMRQAASDIELSQVDVVCEGGRPVFRDPGRSFELRLEGPRDGLGALLPRRLGKGNARAVWTGSHLLTATAAGGSVSVRSYTLSRVAAARAVTRASLPGARLRRRAPSRRHPRGCADGAGESRFDTREAPRGDRGTQSEIGRSSSELENLARIGPIVHLCPLTTKIAPATSIWFSELSMSRESSPSIEVNRKAGSEATSSARTCESAEEILTEGIGLRCAGGVAFTQASKCAVAGVGTRSEAWLLMQSRRARPSLADPLRARE